MSKTTQELWRGFQDECKTESLKQIIENPRCAFYDEIWRMFPFDSSDLNGKMILVPSSGDNLAAFAFSLLGANVTSTDIKQEVLDEAKKRAEKYNIKNITFLKSNSMTLTASIDDEQSLSNDKYDLVFTSNGVYNCLNNIQNTHNAFFRVLKPNGAYCFYENHPFYNKMDEEIDKTGARYIGTGKLRFEVDKYNTKIMEESDGIENFYVIEDYINSLLNAGFEITCFYDISRCEGVIPILSSSNTNIKFIIKPKLPSWIAMCAKKNK